MDIFTSRVARRVVLKVKYEYDIDGNMTKRICIKTDGSCTFTYPRYITVGKSGYKLVVLGPYKETVQLTERLYMSHAMRKCVFGSLRPG